MQRLIFLVLIGVGTSLQAQSIKDLDFLIGEWEVLETIYPGTDKAYTESGTRRCEYYLNNSYIKCESATTPTRTGKTRYYAYLINYDHKNDCFWATGLANDFPLQSHHQWFLDKESQEIRAITPRNVNGDRFFRGTISFADPNKLVWNGWRSRFKGEKEWEQVFNDIATKKGT
ncbi:MAG: hypothetical protein R8G66_24820 [Cytophagales bacterium]|nr:hypothetical protein [Cytophagales bacterium]